MFDLDPTLLLDLCRSVAIGTGIVLALVQLIDQKELSVRKNVGNEVFFFIKLDSIYCMIDSLNSDNE
jgi:hypothetical protein